MRRKYDYGVSQRLVCRGLMGHFLRDGRGFHAKIVRDLLLLLFFRGFFRFEFTASLKTHNEKRPFQQQH